MYTFVPYPTKKYAGKIPSIRASGQGVETTRIAALEYSNLLFNVLHNLLITASFTPSQYRKRIMRNVAYIVYLMLKQYSTCSSYINISAEMCY